MRICFRITRFHIITVVAEVDCQAKYAVCRPDGLSLNFIMRSKIWRRSPTSHVQTPIVFAHLLSVAMFQSRINLGRSLSYCVCSTFHGWQDVVPISHVSVWSMPIQPSVCSKTPHRIYDHPVRYNHPSSQRYSFRLILPLQDQGLESIHFSNSILYAEDAKHTEHSQNAISGSITVHKWFLALSCNLIVVYLILMGSISHSSVFCIGTSSVLHFLQAKWFHL